VHAGGAERQEGQGRVPAVREGEARRTAGLVNHGRGELNRGRGQRRQGCFRRHGEAQERRQGDDGEQGHEYDDEDDEVVDQREYMSMIGSLLYLTVIRPDIQFIMMLYACFQASPVLFT
jgi:hypothetical protein